MSQTLFHFSEQQQVPTDSQNLFRNIRYFVILLNIHSDPSKRLDVLIHREKILRKEILTRAISEVLYYINFSKVKKICIRNKYKSRQDYFSKIN